MLVLQLPLLCSRLFFPHVIVRWDRLAREDGLEPRLAVVKRAQDGAGAAFTPSAGFNALHLSWAVVLEYIIRGTVVPKACMLLQMNLQLLVDPVQETGVFHGVFALVHGESDGEASAPLTFNLPCTDPHGAALGAPRGGAPGSALLTAAHEESRELELVLVRRERVVQLDLAPSPPGPGGQAALGTSCSA